MALVDLDWRDKRNWEQVAPFDGAVISVPAVFDGTPHINVESIDQAGEDFSVTGVYRDSDGDWITRSYVTETAEDREAVAALVESINEIRRRTRAGNAARIAYMERGE